MNACNSIEELEKVTNKHKDLWKNPEFLKLGKEIKESFTIIPKTTDDILKPKK